MDDTEFLRSVFVKAMYCRNFEQAVGEAIDEKLITLPTYLSVGQEVLPATISELYPEAKLFGQHRCHSWYLSYGGDPEALARELLELPNYMDGYAGSASIHIPDKMYGHDGLLGSNAPIAVGYAEASQNPTICILGDAAVEEDYALGAISRAATTKPPILFLVEDNDLSILTEKKMRRSWDIINVSKGFGLEAFQVQDDPLYIKWCLEDFWPVLLNIGCCRHRWHAGNGTDGTPAYDRLDMIDKELKDRLATLNYEQMALEVLTNAHKIGILWERLKKVKKGYDHEGYYS